MNTNLFIVYALFFFSGVSGLIYEVVWLRMLTRVLGGTVYATSVVLASFMAGMAIGSYLFGRYADRIKNNLKLYASLEALVGISALLFTFSINKSVPLYRIVYGLAGGERLWLTLFQSALIFLALLIPACLMGGTLPVLSAYTKKHDASFGRRMGYLYGLNTAGAVMGVLGSGMYSIGELGEARTLAIAVLLNVAIAFVAYFMAVAGHAGPSKSARPILADNAGSWAAISPYKDSVRKRVIIAYSVSGFTAMAYEIIWSRMFQIQAGTSIYAFSLMLAFYLAGIGLGSLAGGKFADRLKNPLILFALSQLFVAAYSIAGMFIFTRFEPDIGYNLNFQKAILVPLVIVFPITFVLGFVFPLVCRSCVKNETHAGSGIGAIYSANTFGCIAGSLACGFILIGLLGTKNTVILLALFNICTAYAVLRASAFAPNKKLIACLGVFPAAIMALAVFLPDPFLLVEKRLIENSSGESPENIERYYHRESAQATTSAFGLKGDSRRKFLLINGVGMTKLCVETKLMAHIPILMHKDPKEMLVVCFGMGTALRSAMAHEGLRIDVAEIVADTYRCFGYYHKNGAELLKNPRVRCYVDDGRNFLLMRPKRYDIITMDPSPPIWSAGTVNLYTKEFFGLCSSRLNEDGVMCAWIPPDRFSEVVMIMKTFQSVFPNTYLLGGPQYAGFYLLGLKKEGKPDLGRFAEAGKNDRVIADINEWGNMFSKPDDILKLLILKPEQLSFFVKDFAVITDSRPYTEFPLWRSIYDRMYWISLDAKALTSFRDRFLLDMMNAENR